MKVIMEFIKELILFVLIWKLLLYLCPQKWIRDYGKAILGIYLTILCLNRFCIGDLVDMDTINREMSGNAYINWDYMTELFTYEENVKTRFDDEEMHVEKNGEIQQNQGLLQNGVRGEGLKKVPNISLRNEISTTHVENIQSINNE